MADVHVLEGPNDHTGQGGFRVAYHVAVPAAVQAKVALVAVESVVPNIESAEALALAAGAIVEIVGTVSLTVGATISNMQAEAVAFARAHWHVLQAEQTDSLTYRYTHYGTTLARS